MSSDLKSIPIARPALGEEEAEAARRAILSGWVTQGPEVAAFEEEFADYVGARHACAVSSCTTALHLALHALGVDRGHEVVTVSHSFIATANAVRCCGARPVFVDIDPLTYNLDPGRIEAVLSPRTRAILCVHQLGMPCDLSAIVALARRAGLWVVEDAACASGSEIRWGEGWDRVGRPHGDLACFSLHARKVITTGEGGMLTTNDAALYQRARRLRDHAMSPERRYFHEERGFNYRITNLQAALGVAQLERIDEFLNRRTDIMNWYHSEIAASAEVRLNRVKNWAKSAFWMVCLEVDWFDEKSREAFMQALKRRGIDSRPYFCTMSALPMYRQTPLPVAAKKAQIGLNLPSFFALTKSDVRRIGADVNELLREMCPA